MVKDAVLFMAVLPSHGAVPYTESGAKYQINEKKLRKAVTVFKELQLKNVLKQRYIQLGLFWAVGLLQIQNSEQDPMGEA